MKKFLSVFDRKPVFSKIWELCEKMNHWFDLCTQKDKKRNNLFLKFGPNNGKQFAMEFFAILRWFTEWETWMRANSPPGKKFDEMRFIPKETFRSHKYVCYSFAALIHRGCIKWKLFVLPGKINQDMCKHHSATVRQSCMSHSGVNQAECMGAVKRSSMTRMKNV
jgi:hypothetical protein